MICAKCGARLEDNAGVCQICGEKPAPEEPAFPGMAANLAASLLTAAIIVLTVLSYFVLPLVRLNTGISEEAPELFGGESSFAVNEVYGRSAKYRDDIISAALSAGVFRHNSYDPPDRYIVVDAKNAYDFCFNDGNTVFYILYMLSFGSVLPVLIGAAGVLSFGCKKPAVKAKGSLPAHYYILAGTSVLMTVGMISLNIFLYSDLPEKLFSPSPLLPVMTGCFAAASVFICWAAVRCRKAVRRFRQVNKCKWR